MLIEGYIALQAESHPIDFKNIEILNLCGCMDPKAKNYKSYFIKSEPWLLGLSSIFYDLTFLYQKPLHTVLLKVSSRWFLYFTTIVLSNGSTDLIFIFNPRCISFLFKKKTSD